MAKEPKELDDNEISEPSTTKKKGSIKMPVVVGTIAAIMLLEAVLLVVVMRGCDTGEAGIGIPTAGNGTRRIAGQAPVNPTIEIEARVFNLRPESMAEPINNVNMGFSLEIANKAQEMEVVEEVMKIMPWINDLLIEKTGRMSYSEAREPETRRRLAQDILGEINNKIGTDRDGRPKIRNLYWQVFHLY